MLDAAPLLPLLDDGPFETPLWYSFLDALQTQLAANYAGIVFRSMVNPQTTSVHLFSARGAPPELLKLYREGFGRDPVSYTDMQEGHVYSFATITDALHPDDKEFFSAFLILSGSVQSRLVRVTEPSGVSAWLCVTSDDPAFGDRESTLLSTLVPHFRRSLRCHVAIERERFRASVATEAIQRLDFGWLTLDASGHLVEISPHAERLLRQYDGLSLTRDGRLRPADASVRRDLAATLEGFSGNPSARPRALHIARDPWFEMLLVPVQDRTGTAPERPAVIVYLHGDQLPTGYPHEQIAELFGLSPSEARLALALSRGLSIREAAADLGLTEGTARTYSKKVYEKMGARGQPDLIRFILTSVLALA